ncbi:MAG: NAD(P)/FAD-dependent oxidoreductase [Desulfatiglandaceae bacterium]
MKSKPKVVVVGAGLSGLAAAGVLCGKGCNVVIVDEGMQPGGQYLKRPEPSLGRLPWNRRDSLSSLGLSLIKQIALQGAEFMPGAQVVGADGGRSLWVENAERRLVEMRSEAVLFATGARERFVPFNGWTLPGVISTGAAQLLLKTCGVLPAKRMVVAGCGPLPLTVAAEISAAGVRIQGLIYQTPLLPAGKIFFRLAAYPLKMVEAWKSLFRLAAAGVLLRPGAAVIKAVGDEVLQEVVYCSLDREGNLMPGSEKTIRTECLAVGHGFAANIELPQAAGCRLSFDKDAHGWAVEVDECMRTSLPGIYASGELTGVAGARKSLIEGQISGHSIARDLGLEKEQGYQPRLRRLRRIREKEINFGRLINRVSVPPVGLWRNIHDDTIICRCEDVTMGNIRKSSVDGVLTPGGIKRATRCGMGMCQGRTCGPVLHDLISMQAGFTDPVPPLSARIPVKPIGVSSLLDRADVGDKDTAPVNVQS